MQIQNLEVEGRTKALQQYQQNRMKKVNVKIYDSTNNKLHNKPAKQPTIVINNLQETSLNKPITVQEINTVLNDVAIM